MAVTSDRRVCTSRLIGQLWPYRADPAVRRMLRDAIALARSVRVAA